MYFSTSVVSEVGVAFQFMELRGPGWCGGVEYGRQKVSGERQYVPCCVWLPSAWNSYGPEAGTKGVYSAEKQATEHLQAWRHTGATEGEQGSDPVWFLSACCAKKTASVLF